MSTLWATTITAIASFLAGLLGHFIAPFFNWSIEKKRMRFQARRKVIDDLRTLLASRDGYTQNVRENPAYACVRPELPVDFVKAFEGEAIHVKLGGRGQHDPLISRFQDLLVEVEKRWGLI